MRQEKAFYKEQPIELTPSQFRLLSDLGEADGQVKPFEELYFHLHGIHLDRSAARTALSAHMSYLRNKLVAAGCGDYLVNVRGRGYLLEIPEKTDSHTSIINLDLILEQLPVILWTTNPELQINSVLGAGLIQLGLDASTLIGLNLADFPQLENPTHTVTAHREALRGKSSRYEQVLQGRTLQLYIEPSYNEHEQITGCIGLALDITERKEAEEVYQILVNHSRQGLTIFQNKRFVFANAAAAELTGYSVDELLALHDPIELFHPDDRPTVRDNLRRRMLGEEVPVNSSFRILRKDGVMRWIEQTAFMTNFRGQLAIHTAASDKTQEKQAVDERRQFEEMYRLLVKNLPQMGVLLFDHDLRFLIAEGQALEEMGFHRELIEGKTIWEVLPASLLDTLLPHYHTALEGQETRFDLPIEDRIFEVLALPLKDDEGQTIAGMLIIHDVTRHKRIAS